MKIADYKYIVGVVLLVLFSLTSCQDDEKVTINTMAENGSLTFKLNSPAYTNYTLLESNAAAVMDSFTCNQPDYGFTAVVTYSIETSFNSDMSDSISLESPITARQKIAVNIKELNKAILRLYSGNMPKPTVDVNVYLRLRAVISNAINNPIDSILVVKPAYSNAIVLKIHPYFMRDLSPYYQITPLPYFIVGYNSWDNNKAGLTNGGLIPLSVVPGSVYDGDGNGIFSYTGYFDSTKEFKLIKKIGDWNEQWGNDGSAGINSPVHNVSNSSNFKVPNSGYYTITLNSISNSCTITSIETEPTSYSVMGLTGSIAAISNWGTGLALTPCFSSNNHMWRATVTLDADGICKFRSGSTWIGGAYFPNGLGSKTADNISFTAGTYNVFFNDIDNCYYFFK